MRVGTRVALIGLGLTAMTAPALAQAAPQPQTSVQRIYSFDGAGDGVLLVSGPIDPGKGRGLFATVSGRADRAGGVPSAVFFPHIIDLETRGAHTYGAIGQRDLCIDPQVVCGALTGGKFVFSTSYTVSGDGEHPAHVRFAIVARGAKVTFKEKMIGWTGRDLRGARQVTDEQADGTGAAAFGASAGATLAASAAAGPRGSIALAAPPCDVAGAGISLLSGPSTTTPGVCPTDAFAAADPRGGTWTLGGLAAGVSGRTTRLLVLDL
jgi:hypothetical protein